MIKAKTIMVSMITNKNNNSNGDISVNHNNTESRLCLWNNVMVIMRGLSFCSQPCPGRPVAPFTNMV